MYREKKRQTRSTIPFSPLFMRLKGGSLQFSGYWLTFGHICQYYIKGEKSAVYQIPKQLEPAGS